MLFYKGYNETRGPSDCANSPGAWLDLEGRSNMVQRIRTCPNPAKWLHRIAESIIQDGDCWRWIGRFGRGGYGAFKYNIDGRQHGTTAHRASWLAHRGDIPDDLVTDHLCRNRWCVNPWHLELVTTKINNDRADRSNSPRRSGGGRKVGWRLDSDLRTCRLHGREDGYLGKWAGFERWVCRICRRSLKRRQYLLVKEG